MVGFRDDYFGVFSGDMHDAAAGLTLPGYQPFAPN